MVFQVTINRQADVDALDLDKTVEAIKERSEFLHQIFEEAGPDVDHRKVKAIAVEDGNALARQIDARNDEIGWLGKRRDLLRQAEKFRTGDDPDAPPPSYSKDPRAFAPGSPKAIDRRSIGQQFVESDVFKGLKGEPKGKEFNLTLPVDVKSMLAEAKATFLTTSGWAPETTRIPRVILDEQRPIEIVDAVPVFRTGQAAVVYMEETTFTNAAAERAENASYAEGTLILTERTSNVRSIGVSLPVTDEQLADVEGIIDYLDQRLEFMVRQRLDGQIIAGDGNAPNLAGTLNVAGINTQALGADTVPDAVYKGMDLVRTTGRAEPSIVYFHPADWQPVRLLKTADGVYIWGSPSDSGPDRIWGSRVIKSTGVTQNTAVTGDYAGYAGLFVRQDIEIAAGYVSNDFLQGRRTFRAGIRAALVHFRPSAFTQITGI